MIARSVARRDRALSVSCRSRSAKRGKLRDDRPASTGALFAAWLAVGCGELLGADEYRIAEPAVDNPCGALAVPIGDTCETIGVSHPCANGFVDDEAGGCAPILDDGPCPRGLVQLPGVADCRPITQCFEGFPNEPNPLTGALRWVDTAAQTEGDGTDRERPLRTIRGALESTSGPATILVAAGDYVEDNLVIDRPIDLAGLCAERTHFIARSPDRPALAIGAGAGDTHIGALRISGGKGGIAVDGATGVTVSGVVIDGTDGPGISFEDSSGAAEGRITGVLVEGALGIGIATYGAKVQVVGSVVRGTRTTPDGDLGRGISAHPSAFVDPTVIAMEALRQCKPSELTIEDTVIEVSSDAGVFLAGSMATIDRSVVRDTGPGRNGHGRGIVAESWDLGGLVSKLTVTQSFIERTADVALRIDNACATVEDTTIRDVGNIEPPVDPFAGERSCLGNGIRVRFNRPAAEPSPCADAAAPLVVRRSLIENTREAGIHVEGAAASIERTIVRSVKEDACGDRFGDGIAAYGYDYSPASLQLRAVRVEETARAAVASFGAETSVVDSVLACNDRDLAAPGTDALGQSATATVDRASSVCGCGEDWRRCGPPVSALSSSLRGCGDPDKSGTCTRVCYSDWLEVVQGTTRGIPGMNAWDVDRDDIATTVSDPGGCLTNGGWAPGLSYRAASVMKDYIPGIGFFVATSAPREALMFSLLGSGTFNLGAGLAMTRQDLRHGIFAAVWVCEQSEHVTDSPVFACLGHGVEGARVELSPPAGIPIYVNEQGIPQLDVPSITKSSVATFWNIPPGEYTARILPPDGATGIDCSAAQNGTNGLLAWPTDVLNEFTIRVEPSTIQGIFVFCTVQR